MAHKSDPNCPFCKIISGEYPSKKVYEDSKVICVLDINPAAKGHLLLVPKNHYPIMPVIPPDEFKHISRAAVNMSEILRSTFFTSKNKIFIANGGVAGQQVSHFLVHIIPGEPYSLDVSNVLEKDDTLYDSLKQNLPPIAINQLKRAGKSISLLNTGHLFESDEMIARIPEKISSKGHIEVVSKKKLSMSSVEDFMLLSNSCATATFDYLGANGSNIIIDEAGGILKAQIIPRFSGDGLNFMWQASKADQDELETIKKSIVFGTIGMSLEEDMPKNSKLIEKPQVEKSGYGDPIEQAKNINFRGNFISNKIGKSGKLSLF